MTPTTAPPPDFEALYREQLEINAKLHKDNSDLKLLLSAIRTITTLFGQEETADH